MGSLVVDMEDSYMDSLIVDIEAAVFWECQAHSMLKPLFVDFGKTVGDIFFVSIVNSPHFSSGRRKSLQFSKISSRQHDPYII
jgi:hypothetical protein